MPYQSKAQHAKFRAMESRGELPKGTSEKWARETPNIKRLPARKHAPRGDANDHYAALGSLAKGRR